jgi:hypothetical protein
MDESLSGNVRFHRRGGNMHNLVYIGFSLIGFGLAFFLYLILLDKPEQNDDDEIN